MSDPSSDPSSDQHGGTLYNPPASSDESSESDEETVGLTLSLSEEQAKRLRAVAQQLGLNPSTIAQRAIQMVCDEVVTIQDDNRPPNLLVEQYQARIDLLHAVDDGSPDQDSIPPAESDTSESEGSEASEEYTESGESTEE